MADIEVVVREMADAQEGAVAILVLFEVGPYVAITSWVGGKEIVGSIGIFHEKRVGNGEGCWRHLVKDVTDVDWRLMR